jgi:hypothetical protein
VNKHKQSLRQETIVLPYFDHEVPVVYLDDGTPYIPVRALCEMLGLHADTHIRRWRNLVLWASARKLPYRSKGGKIQVVWCLHRGAVSQLCCCFNWSLVSAERREQLTRATDEWFSQTAIAYREMLAHYRYIRSFLFEFLAAYTNADAWLDQCAARLLSRLHSDSLQRLESLLLQGRKLIAEATTHTRTILHEQATMPILDVVRLDPVGEVIDTFSVPLLPIVPREECGKLFASIRTLSQWHQEMAAFERDQRKSHDGHPETDQ